MAITFSCSCGKTLQVKDVLGGKRVRCPACSDAITVPAAEEPAWEVVEDEPEPPPAPIRAKAVARSRDDDDDDDRPRRRREEDDEYEERPRKKKRFKPKKKVRREREKEEHSHFAIEKGILGSGVAGGAIAMVVAVVWFILGLMNDWIFYYPPILFVIGLVAFFKGLVGGNDE